MAVLILGLVVFIGAHLFTAGARGARGALIEKMSLGGYKGLFSVVAGIGLALIIIGWRMTPPSPVWTPPTALRGVTYLLMIPALVLITAAYLPAGKIKAATKHPMLAAVKIWAFAHLLANGELRSLVLFSSLLAYAVINRILAKKRGDLGPVPGPVLYDIVAIVGGVAGYAAIFLYLHPYLAGVALVG